MPDDKGSGLVEVFMGGQIYVQPYTPVYRYVLYINLASQDVGFIIVVFYFSISLPQHGGSDPTDYGRSHPRVGGY